MEVVIIQPIVVFVGRIVLGIVDGNLVRLLPVDGLVFAGG